jgi:hypothetical protein
MLYSNLHPRLACCCSQCRLMAGHRSIKMALQRLLRKVRTANISAQAIIRLWDEFKDISKMLDNFHGSQRQKLILGGEQQKVYQAIAAKMEHVQLNNGRGDVHKDHVASGSAYIR